MAARRSGRAALAAGACLAVLAWGAAVAGPADASGPPVREPGLRERRESMDGSASREAGMAGRRDESADGRVSREPGSRERRGPDALERPPAAEREAPRGPALREQPGQLTPDKVERWRRMSPEERERIRERYRMWKSLPPERRERLIERNRKWRALPEPERRFLRQRREMYRDARPEERRVIDEFVVRVRRMPPDLRRGLKIRIAEWRDLPAAERDERMMEWPFYRGLRPDERRVMRWFLFSGPEPSPFPPPPRD